MGDTWYFSSGGKAVGPNTLEDIQQLIAAGKLGPNDQVCSDGQNWHAVSATPELQLVAAAAAPSLVGYQARSTSDPIVSALAVDLVRQTGFWCRIMSILMFVGSGLMFCVGIFMLVAGVAFATRTRGEAPPPILGLVYIAMAALYLAPALYLFRFASRAKAFFRLRHERLLEEALAAQKSFWKFTAILSIVVISLYLLMIPVAILMFAVLHR